MDPLSIPIDDEQDDNAAGKTPPPRDPLIRPLALVAAILGVAILVVILVNVVSIVNRGGAPRTAMERQLLQAEAAAKQDPASFSNWAELAGAYVAADKPGKAKDAVKRAEEIQPDNCTVFLIYGDIAVLDEDYATALEYYEAGLKYGDQPPAAVKESAAERRLILPDPYYQEDANTLAYAAAQIHMENEDWDSALERLVQAVKFDAMDSSSWSLMGDVYAETGEDDKARDAYNEALRYVPDYRPALDGLQKLED